MAKWQVMMEAQVCFEVEANTQEEAEDKANKAPLRIEDVEVCETYLVVNVDTGEETFK